MVGRTDRDIFGGVFCESVRARNSIEAPRGYASIIGGHGRDPRSPRLQCDHRARIAARIFERIQHVNVGMYSTHGALSAALFLAASSVSSEVNL